MTTVAAMALAPAMAQERGTSSPSAPSATTPSAQAPGGATSGNFVTQQNTNQWLASKLIGTKVVNRNNERIGEVDDLVVAQDGSVQAAVIGVGGFLGLGEKNVALEFKSLQFDPNPDDPKVMVQMSKAELEKAPEFKAKEEPRAQRAPGGTSKPGMKQ